VILISLRNVTNEKYSGIAQPSNESKHEFSIIVYDSVSCSSACKLSLPKITYDGTKPLCEWYKVYKTSSLEISKSNIYFKRNIIDKMKSHIWEQELVSMSAWK
jgi:hypothetical protein